MRKKSHRKYNSLKNYIKEGCFVNPSMRGGGLSKAKETSALRGCLYSLALFSALSQVKYDDDAHETGNYINSKLLTNLRLGRIVEGSEAYNCMLQHTKQ